VNSHLSSTIHHCSADLGVLSQDSNDYDINWNLTASPSASASNAFRYTKAFNISSYPLTGVYASYLGGGYVYQMSGNSQIQIMNDMAFLQANGWIDRQTRAVVVEFNLYNPNAGMFAYCYLLFEILPTGSILGSARFSPMTLFDDRSSLFSFTTIAAVVYLVMIFILTFKRVYNVYLHRIKYFKRAWTYLDLTIIAFSFTSFSIWLYRVWEAQFIMSTLASNLNSTSSSSSSKKVVSLQMLAYWDDTLACMLAFCGTLGTLKFLKLLKSNSTIQNLALAFQLGFVSIVGFVIVFFLTTFAFLQFGFVTFHDRILDFSTFIKTMETGVLLILGKFALTDMLEANAVWTVVFHVLFNVCIVFIMFQLFVTLICDSFQAAKEETSKSEQLSFSEFFTDRIESVFKIFQNLLGKKDKSEHGGRMRNNLLGSEMYRDPIDSFVHKTDEFILQISNFKESRDKVVNFKDLNE
jgi:hypothetical protein